MAELSVEAIQIIASYPIGAALDPFRQSFRSACDKLGLADSPESTTEVISSEDGKRLTRRLISYLQYQEVMELLPSKTSKSSLAFDLVAIYLQSEDDKFNRSQIIPLCTLVIDKASDEVICKALFELIEQVIDFARSETLSIHSSDLLEHRRQVNRRLFWNDIFPCTYREVDGFFAKYFDGMSAAAQANRVYQSAKSQHVDGRWVDFPNPPLQNLVLDWFFRLQADFFADQRGIYTSRRDEPLHGFEAMDKPDLFIRKRDVPAALSPHDWADTWVIGKVKEGPCLDRSLLLQLAGYALKVFASQPTRRFVHGFTLCITKMQLWVFDRSGPYCSTEFDIHAQPEQFVQAMVSYLMMSDMELGLDTFVERHDKTQSITVPGVRTEGNIQLQLDPRPIARQKGIVGRGTGCYRARKAGSVSWEYVVKFSWQSDTRRAEVELLRVAQQKQVEGVADLVAHKEIDSIQNLRSGLKFWEAHDYRNDSRSASTYVPYSQDFSFIGNEIPDNSYETGVLHCLVTAPLGRPLRSFRSVKELLEAFRDAIKAHRSLLEKGNILHRDISENNIIITDPKESAGYTGMLIDLDMSEMADSVPSGTQCCAGTKQFLAIEVLRGRRPTYRHDLESFLYVFLWVCICYGWKFSGDEERREPRLLQVWYDEAYQDIADYKFANMSKTRFQEIVIAEFPPRFERARDAAGTLRDLLFPIRDDDIFTGTPTNPEELYEPMIAALDLAARACIEE